MIYSAKNNQSGNSNANKTSPDFMLSEPFTGAAESSEFFSHDNSNNNVSSFVPTFTATTRTSPFDDDSAYSQNDSTFAENLKPMEYIDGSKSLSSNKQKKKLLKPWGYFGLLVLFSIPFIGLIFLIVFACSNKDKNRKNFAGGYLLYMLLCFLIFASATAFLIFKFIVPLFPAGTTLNQMFSSVSGASQGESLSAEQLAAIESGDFRALTPEQIAGIDRLFDNMDQAVIDNYLATPPTKYEATIITTLPSALPETFSGKRISSFVLDEKDVSYYTVIGVTTAELEEFKEGLSFTMNPEGSEETSSTFNDPTTNKSVKLDYAEDDRMLTILIYSEQV